MLYEVITGKIDAVIGIKRDFKELTGISFTANNETPGLGARITEKWFCEQFSVITSYSIHYTKLYDYCSGCFLQTGYHLY